jgi:hypothetical protein
MTSDRIKEIQNNTNYPYSTSVQQALLQVWNECAQESYSYDEVRAIAYKAYCIGQLDEPTEGKFNQWINDFKKK